MAPITEGTEQTMTDEDVKTAQLVIEVAERWHSEKTADHAKRILATYAALAEKTAEVERLQNEIGGAWGTVTSLHGQLDAPRAENRVLFSGNEKLAEQARTLRTALAEAQAIIEEAQASYDSVNFAYEIDEGVTIPVMILRLATGKRICGDFRKDIMPDPAPGGTENDR